MLKHLSIPILVIGLLLAGCGASETIPSSTPEPVSVSDWYDDHGAIVDEGGERLGAIADAAGDYDLDAVSEACAALGGWADRAEDLPPIPDSDVDDAWSAAVEEASLAADACVQGILTDDPTLIDASTEHVAAMTDHITEATEAVEAGS